MTVKLFRVALALLCLTGGLAWPVAVTAQSGATYVVTQVNAAGFPAVSFDLRAIDASSHQPNSTLNSSTVAVYENGQPMPNVLVTPLTDGPLNIIFVVDLGRTSNYSTFGLDNLRAAMTTLVSGGFFVDGRDTVAVYTRKNVTSDQTIEAVPPTTSAADFTTRLATFDFAKGSGNAKGLLGIEAALTKMGQLVPVAGSQTSAIIYLTRYIEDPNPTAAIDAASLTAEQARQQHIPIYVFQTDPQQTYRDTLQVLTANTFGQYVSLNNNTVVPDVGAIYAALNAQRTHYAVSYTSTSGVSGPRQITVNAPALSGSDVAGAYDITVNAPTATIVEPPPGSAIRREGKTSGGTTAFDVSSVTVSASLTWMDNPRALTTAELYVDGVLKASQPNIPAGAPQVDFAWDFSEVVKPGDNALSLEVRLTDELGLTASANATLTIQVIVPTPTPRPRTPTPTPTPNRGIDLTDPKIVIGLIVCVLSAAVIAFGAVMIVILRPKGETPPAPVSGRSAAVSSQATLIGGVAPSGALTVLVGPARMVNQTIALTKPETKLGRNPAMADIIFYADEPSSVSRWHCTIFNNNLGAFQLVDNNSSSGTQVNGQRLAPGAPMPLAEGADIVLGDLAQRGVRLRFSLSAGGGAGGVSSDKTFIFNPGEDQNWDKFAE